ncbi:hypothetical protein M301_2475 [Methylotenera versatilis 301]|uniref:Uncharacterized protein n=1 Tax=Methylotenera versatilis (strain 301) TaxID=666681 RepID=D7DMR0_METV0|nr:hypothetical protein M301_2475 [Methylotenera versatilis 301]
MFEWLGASKDKPYHFVLAAHFWVDIISYRYLQKINPLSANNHTIELQIQREPDLDAIINNPIFYDVAYNFHHARHHSNL